MKMTEKYLSDYPLLMNDWVQELNIGIIPERVTAGSHQYILWRCHKCGREWSAPVNNRVNGTGCTCDARERKILALQKTLVKKRGSLADVRPDLAAQWHPTKNGDITPHDVTAKSTYKVWWIDGNGNEWKQEIAVRNRSKVIKGFPEQRLLVNHNDLRTEHPEIAATWHPTKNGEAIPENFKSGSSIKVWWLCEKGHEWQAGINSRVAGRGCPICNKERSTSFPEQALYFYVKKLFPDAENRYYVETRLEIDIYIPSIKIGIEYDGSYYHKSERKKNIDEKKNKRLKELGITLIRVVEEGGDIPQNSDYVIGCARVNSVAQIDQATTELFCLLGKMVEQRFDIDIDSDRDRTSIMEQYILSEKKNSLAGVAPEVLKEWHPTKNGYIKPEYIHAMSNKQFWWKCNNCGYEWKTPAYRRAKGMGCPVCAGNIVASGINDLLTTQPVIMTEWDYDKNKSIDPRKYSAGSIKKVWWNCHVCGYQWAAVISNRTRGRGCPQCSGKVVDPKKSFAVEHPELLEQWAYDLNRGMKPEDFLSGSECKVWWRCSNGHTWQSTITNRSANNNCPFCGNKIVLAGFNDFATVHPELLNEWDYEKNIVKPDEVLGGSNTSIHWICSRGHRWEARISNRIRGNGCPYCKNRKIVVGENDLASLYPILAEEWNYQRNVKMSPSGVTPGSNKKVWWKCRRCNGEWDAYIWSRVKGRGCPYCAGVKPVVGVTDFAAKMPELVQEWDYKRNKGINPQDYMPSSRAMVWWKCKNCNYEWKAAIGARSRGRCRCPKCAGKIKE